MITLINVWPQIFNFLMKTLEIYSLSNTEIYIQLFLYLACCASDLKKITLIPPEGFVPFDYLPILRTLFTNLRNSLNIIGLNIWTCPQHEGRWTFFCFQTNEQVTPERLSGLATGKIRKLGVMFTSLWRCFSNLHVHTAPVDLIKMPWVQSGASDSALI